MSVVQKAIQSVFWGSVIMGVGYACYRLGSPTREQLINALPEEERKALEAKLPEIRARNQALFDVLKKNAQSDLPAWQVLHKDKETELNATKPAKS